MKVEDFLPGLISSTLTVIVKRDKSGPREWGMVQKCESTSGSSDSNGTNLRDPGTKRVGKYVANYQASQRIASRHFSQGGKSAIGILQEDVWSDERKRGRSPIGEPFNLKQK